MDCNTPGFPVYHQLPEFTQTHVHRVGDVIQPSHSSVAPFSSCLQSFPASGSFPMSQLFTSGSQNTGASASASVLPMNMQGRFPLGLTGLISLQTKGLSRVFPSTTVQKHQFFGSQPSLWSDSHIHIWLLKKNKSFDYMDFVSKVLSLLCNTLSRSATPFLPRSKRLLILWLHSPSTETLAPKKIKPVTVSTFSPIYLPWSDGTRGHDLKFFKVEFQASFLTVLFHQQAL